MKYRGGESSLNWGLETYSTSYIRQHFQLNASHPPAALGNSATWFFLRELHTWPILSVHSLTRIRWCPARTTIGSCLRPSPRWLVEWLALRMWPLRWASAHEQEVFSNEDLMWQNGTCIICNGANNNQTLCFFRRTVWDTRTTIASVANFLVPHSLFEVTCSE